MKSYTIQEINEILKGEIIGNTFQKITAPEQLEAANESEISFIGNKKSRKITSCFVVLLLRVVYFFKKPPNNPIASPRPNCPSPS